MLLPLWTVQCSVADEAGSKPEVNQAASSDGGGLTDTSQLCSAQGSGGGSSDRHPNGFTVAWVPTPFDFGTAPERWVGAIYPTQSVRQVVGFYTEHNRIVGPMRAAFHERQLAKLNEAFDRAAALAQAVSKAAVSPTERAPGTGPYGTEIEYVAPALAIHIAFLILTIDEDYKAFETRVGKLLKSNPVFAKAYDFRQAGSPTAIGRQRVFSPGPTGAIRAIVLYRLLTQDYRRAEDAMLHLVEETARVDRLDSYAPYSPLELSDHIRANQVALTELIHGRELASADQRRCSDLFALYIEWLDLSSRAALFSRDAGRLEMLRAEADRLKRNVPGPMIGPRYQGALRQIQRRVAAQVQERRL